MFPSRDAREMSLARPHGRSNRCRWWKHLLLSGGHPSAGVPGPFQGDANCGVVLEGSVSRIDVSKIVIGDDPQMKDDDAKIQMDQMSCKNQPSIMATKIDDIVHSSRGTLKQFVAKLQKSLLGTTGHLTNGLQGQT